MPVQRRGMRALQIWVARVTAEYTNVNIVDLTTSFRDGLAFCAIIHHFRPDLMPEWDSLDEKDVYKNNELAFRVAEEELDVPSLLDPQDMVDCSDPDKFSIVTYVSQFYHLFKDADGSRSSPEVSPLVSRVTKKVSESGEENDSLLSSSENTPLTTRKPLFNQADLIAKYGEEIFSKSSSPERGCVTPVKKSSVGAICNGLVKARISATEEKR